MSMLEIAILVLLVVLAILVEAYLHNSIKSRIDELKVDYIDALRLELEGAEEHIVEQASSNVSHLNREAEKRHENLEKHMAAIYDRLGILTDFGEQLADPESPVNKNKKKGSYEEFIADPLAGF